MYSKFSDRIMAAQYKFLTGVDPLAKAVNVLQAKKEEAKQTDGKKVTQI